MSAPILNCPIIIVGAGGIVRDAHLPAYSKAGYRVQGLFDIRRQAAEELAKQYGLQVYSTLEEAVSAADPRTVFDVAVPATATESVLRALPGGHGVLIQKPMGGTLAQARTIRDVCREKGLTGAVNFQLRFAPPVALARSMINGGVIGDIVDMEVRMTCYTPWHMWPFLEQSPRVEILYHSIHYIDLIRSFLGDPQGVYALSNRHYLAPRLTSTRSTVILNYGEFLRATVTTNHGHAYGPRNQESFVKWEGTKGAIKIRLGLMLDYPAGQADQFEHVILEEGKAPEWKVTPVQGTWFPDAFMFSMASLLSYLDGSSSVLPASVEDAYRTMAVVEAAYESIASGGTAVRYD
ncbi:MAG: Gfo/Idh/MocA family oxidoreductase [Bryobacterales bacterium]|nr:Gfo/Idh/MocA family oxidoreductase [Bryobacterales bacterium]